jgi:hypothetical protein
MIEEQLKVLSVPKHGLDISAQSCRQGEGPKKSTRFSIRCKEYIVRSSYLDCTLHKPAQTVVFDPGYTEIDLSCVR